MIKNRIFYLLSLLGCFAFYISYNRWLSWFVLLVTLTLPLFSLMISLPFMLSTKVKLFVPKAVCVGEELSIQLKFKSPLRALLVSWKYRIHTSYSPKAQTRLPDDKILAEHCGKIEVELRNAWIYDFLGLFRRKMPKNLKASVLVWPNPILIDDIPPITHPTIWKVKNNGFAENYDLRHYTEGDELRRIHWKLSVKTGKLIVREAIVPIRPTPILTMALCGSADEVDQKLGKLLYVSNYLLEKEFAHELHYSCADGSYICKIANTSDLNETVAQLLRAPVAEDCAVPVVAASWKYLIGGGRSDS